MLRRHVIAPLLRYAFHLFYNPFAFTYDRVSTIVSRGHWRAWTRAALPYLRGARVLELPCGTGNLLCDLTEAGYTPIGADLSPWMLRITRGKLKQADHVPVLVRARAESLPFPDTVFDSVVMTFPPGFVYDARALGELHRVLAGDGILLWVDAGRLLPVDLWNRLLNAALDAVDGGGSFETGAVRLLSNAGFSAQVDWVVVEMSRVAVVRATKG